MTAGPPPPPRAPLDREAVAPLIEAARALAIEVDEATVIAKGAIWGMVGTTKVALGVRFVGGQPAGYAHFAEAEDPVIGPITVEPWTGQARGRQVTGDEAADAALAIHGDPPAVRAWLDAQTRSRLVTLFAPMPRPASLRIERRRVTYRGPSTLALEADRVVEELRAIVDLVQAARLSARPLLERVVHNALDDPEAEVRERNAGVLGELMPSAGPDARYGAAARLLFADGVAIDHRLDVLRMVRGLPSERIAPLMQRVLEEAPLELVRRAVGWMKEQRPPDAVRHLVRALHRFEEPTFCRAVVDAMADMADPRAQTALINLLSREDDALRRDVVRALGRVGTPQALEAIRPYTKGFFVDRELKRVARDAVSAIESRTSGEFPIPDLGE